MQTKITTIVQALEDACQLIEAFTEGTELKQKMAGIVGNYRKLIDKNQKPCKKQ